jgi:hypothetical protein
VNIIYKLIKLYIYIKVKMEKIELGYAFSSVENSWAADVLRKNKTKAGRPRGQLIPARSLWPHVIMGCTC